MLLAFKVPDRLVGLTNRLGFRPTKKDPRNFYRFFNPVSDHDLAVKVRQHFIEAGIKAKWIKIEDDAISQSYSLNKPLALQREEQTQARHLQIRESQDHVQQVLRRARGE